MILDVIIRKIIILNTVAQTNLWNVNKSYEILKKPFVRLFNWVGCFLGAIFLFLFLRFFFLFVCLVLVWFPICISISFFRLLNVHNFMSIKLAVVSIELLPAPPTAEALPPTNGEVLDRTQR